MRSVPNAAALAWAAALALPMSAALASGSASNARELAATCAACHGPPGREPAIPDITGLDENHCMQMLVAYRKGERRSQVMQIVAAALTPDEIAAVAHFLASTPAADAR